MGPMDDGTRPLQLWGTWGPSVSGAHCPPKFYGSTLNYGQQMQGIAFHSNAESRKGNLVKYEWWGIRQDEERVKD